MNREKHLWVGPERCNAETLRQLIRDHSIIRKLKANENYLSPGDPINYVAYVADGVTSHYMFGANGREKVMYRLGSGWFFSEGVFYNEGHIEVASRYAVAEKSTTLYLMDRSNFYYLLGFPQFVQAVLCSTVEKCTILRLEIESVTFDSSLERLKRLLLSCADASNVVDQKWMPLAVSWTHQDIAAVMGINRVTVSRFISDLKGEGFLRMVNGTMQINRKYLFVQH